jgi:hypothetical protein
VTQSCVEAQTNDEKSSGASRPTRRLSKPKKRGQRPKGAIDIVRELETVCMHIEFMTAYPLVGAMGRELLPTALEQSGLEGPTLSKVSLTPSSGLCRSAVS